MNAVETDYLGVVTDGRVTIHSNTIDEINVATQGVTVSAIRSLAKELNWDANILATSIGTTTRTLERYSKDRKRLSAKLSENALEDCVFHRKGLPTLVTLNVGMSGLIHPTFNLRIKSQSQ